jgi:archaellum component FlaD/FlaE
MGLRDVLADFLSSEGPQGGDSTESEPDEDDDEETSPEPGYDVPLEDLDQEEQVENLEHRIDSMKEDLERSTSQIESIQSSQEEVAERVEDINGTVRQLLGIYDQLTASANPFVEGGNQTQMDDDVDGFGLGGEPDLDGATDEMPPADAVETETADPEAEPADEDLADNEVVVEATEPGDEDAVSFDDLKSESETVEAGDDGQQAVQEQREQEDTNADDTQLEVEPLSDEAAQMSEAAEESRSHERASKGSRTGAPGSRSDATLPALADTYATDILVFEWLTDLVTSAGPAATLRAIAYYEEIGWISPEVKAYLEDALSGPDLDMTVDPSRDPNELNAEDHAESYEYIMKLDAIQETMDDTGL